jgi:hypothetical protein
VKNISAMNSSMPGLRISALRPVIEASHHRPVEKGIQLGRNRVIRLEKKSQVTRIEVKSGVAWLTGTPADRDILLPAGGQYDFPDQWPFVIQAVDEVELVLLRAD